MLIIITSMFLIVKEKYTRCMYTTRGQTKFLTFYLYFWKFSPVKELER